MSRDPFNFEGSIHLARAVKSGTQGDYMKSCQRDDKSPRKGHGLAHMTHLCMCICGLKISPRHTIDWGRWRSWQWTCVCRTLDGSVRFDTVFVAILLV